MADVDVDLKTCGTCAQVKPRASFASLPNGRCRGVCRQCRATSARARWKTTAEAQGGCVRGYRLGAAKQGQAHVCSHCELERPATMYQLYKGRPSGWCRACANEAELRRQADPLIQHRTRVQKFERRYRVAVSSDGTVTPVLLANLYAQVVCFYCLRTTSVERRTVDHKTPLIRGGAHSATNLVMACLSCNSRKGPRTEAEFLAWRVTRGHV